MKTMNRILHLSLAFAALLVFTEARAASDMELTTRIFTARKANAALMKTYSWHSRTELLDNGVVKDTRIELVVYGPNGQLQRTLLNDESSPLPRGFLRRRIAEKEKKKVETYLVGLRKLLENYTLPTEGKVLDFVNGATIEAPDANGWLKLTGAGVLSPGDTMTIWVEGATGRMRKVAIVTEFEGDAVTANASFTTLASGLNHLEFGEVDVAAKNLSMKLHNFAYNANN